MNWQILVILTSQTLLFRSSRECVMISFLELPSQIKTTMKYMDLFPFWNQMFFSFYQHYTFVCPYYEALI